MPAISISLPALRQTTINTSIPNLDYLHLSPKDTELVQRFSYFIHSNETFRHDEEQKIYYNIVFDMGPEVFLQNPDILMVSKKLTTYFY